MNTLKRAGFACFTLDTVLIKVDTDKDTGSKQRLVTGIRYNESEAYTLAVFFGQPPIKNGELIRFTESIMMGGALVHDTHTSDNDRREAFTRTGVIPRIDSCPVTAIPAKDLLNLYTGSIKALDGIDKVTSDTIWDYLSEPRPAFFVVGHDVCVPLIVSKAPERFHQMMYRLLAMSSFKDTDNPLKKYHYTEACCTPYASMRTFGAFFNLFYSSPIHMNEVTVWHQRIEERS